MSSGAMKEIVHDLGEAGFADSAKFLVKKQMNDLGFEEKDLGDKDKLKHLIDRIDKNILKTWGGDKTTHLTRDWKKKYGLFEEFI